MKLQGVSVIFALIVLPLILVLTYYIQLQVDTIEMQNEYDRKLLDSTYGAMSAFEINTANEDLSSVSDSLRTIIEASTNIFFNTLATNFGMSNASKSYLEPFIPAILYTLYDGYYISAPTRTPSLLIDSDGNAVSVGDPGVTLSGSDFIYNEVHTSLESQANCTDCVLKSRDSQGREIYEEGSENHVLYSEYSAMNSTAQADLQIKYDDLSDSEKENYGQLLYLKKKTNLGEADKYTTNVDEAELEIEHVLKTYMPYSARYKSLPEDANSFDLSIIYTLDNYVTIQGNIKDVYYTKSGYFIPDNSVEVTEIKDRDDANQSEVEKNPQKLLLYNQNDAKEYIESGALVKIKIKDKINADGSKSTTEGTIISSGGKGMSAADLNEKMRVYNNRYNKAISYIAQLKKIDLTTMSEDDKNIINQFLIETGYDYTGIADLKSKVEFAKIQLTKDLNEFQYQLDEMAAVTYYVTAEIFSNWIYDNLVDINATPVREKHLVEISGQSYNLVKGKTQVSHDFTNSETLIFDIEGSKNQSSSKKKSIMEIDKDSPFYTHKLNIIRDSIQYNLNLAMSTYNNMLISTKDYAMPVMQNEEWEKILNNVSIVSFMQGYNCGLKIYSNYKIVSSTNNEISVLPEEIYYVEKSEFSNENSEYHRIDCSKLYAKDSDVAAGSDTYKYLAFISKEVKYDKLYNKSNAQVPYSYDHKNLACYECINDGNYKGTDIFDAKDGTKYSEYENLRKAYYIGIGKARNNLYKMNAIENSQGYEIIYDGTIVGNTVGSHANTSSLNLSQIKSIEIVLDTIKTHDAEENVLNYKVSTSDPQLLNSTVYTVVPNVATTTTLKVDVDPTVDKSAPISVNKLVFNNLFPQSTAYSAGTDGVDKYQEEADFTKKSTYIVRDSIKLVRVIYR